MPELPEVQTVVTTLQQLIANKTIETIRIYWNKIIGNKTPDAFKLGLVGETFLDFGRKGKYLIFKMNKVTLIAHLRMEGKFYFYQQPTEPNKHSHVIFTFTDGSELHFNDVRKFGKLYLYANDEYPEVLTHVGPEVWDQMMSVEYLQQKFKNKTTALKTVLLDQHIIAGIGNIYANEICFKLGVSPSIPANRLKRKDLSALIDITKEVLEAAIKQGGTTIRSYTSSLGVTGLFQQQLMVHNRVGMPCKICGTNIEKVKLNGRGTYFCPLCQRRKR